MKRIQKLQNKIYLNNIDDIIRVKQEGRKYLVSYYDLMYSFNYDLANRYIDTVIENKNNIRRFRHET